LFGWKSRLNPIMKKFLKDKQCDVDVDVFQFGKKICLKLWSQN